MPGSSLPSTSSRLAPPPVETCADACRLSPKGADGGGSCHRRRRWCARQRLRQGAARRRGCRRRSGACFKDAHGAVPEDGLGDCSGRRLKAADGCGGRCQSLRHVFGEGLVGPDRPAVGAVAVDRRRRRRGPRAGARRQRAFREACSRMIAGESRCGRFSTRLSPTLRALARRGGCRPWRRRCRWCMAARDEQRFDDVDLVGHLGAAEDRDERRGRAR